MNNKPVTKTERRSFNPSPIKDTLHYILLLMYQQYTPYFYLTLQQDNYVTIALVYDLF